MNSAVGGVIDKKAAEALQQRITEAQKHPDIEDTFDDVVQEFAFE